MLSLVLFLEPSQHLILGVVLADLWKLEVQVLFAESLQGFVNLRLPVPRELIDDLPRRPQGQAAIFQ